MWVSEVIGKKVTGKNYTAVTVHVVGIVWIVKLLLFMKCSIVTDTTEL